MGRLVLSEFVTLDGVMEDPGGAESTERGGWAFRFRRGPAGDRFKLDELLAAEALLLGRVTYQGFAKAWPSITDDQGFAEKMNTMRKYVFSSTLPDAEAAWANSVVVRGDVATEAARLRAEASGDLLVAGSGQLAAALIAHGLVDELRLMVYPVLLGTGRQLFPEAAPPVPLTLATAEPACDGVLLLVYHPSAR
jgi:dihydrofolate reductase